MAGKYVIVTGGNTGIGLETAVELARLGAHVVLACRPSAKTNQAVRTIRQRTRNMNVTAEPVDLGDLASIRRFAKRYTASGKPLHLLVNNAGVMWIPKRQVTKDGFEMQLGVNYLGLVLLTHELLPVLKKSAPARIVNVSSIAHTWGSIHFDDFQLQKGYSARRAYEQSKLAIVLYTNELNRRLIGTGITANSLHPGGVRTELGRFLGWWYSIYAALAFPIRWLVMKNAREGAQTTLHVALSPECGIYGGRYWADCKTKQSSNKLVGNVPVEKRLWELTERTLGVQL